VNDLNDLTLALWQTPHPASPAEALQRLDTACAEARAQGADLLVTPEMFCTGYAIGADRVAALAEPADGPLAHAVAAIAQRHGLAIVYGYPEQNGGGKPFNAAQAISADGTRLINYRKTHLFGDMDRAQFGAGDVASQVFEHKGWRLGLLICYDVEFPEAVRSLALQRADAVLVPTANMVGFDEVQNVLVLARACENRLFVAYANACGSEGDTHYGGLSTVAGPQGDSLARTGREPDLLVATLQRSVLQAARQHDHLRDRRTDLYGPFGD